MDFLVDNKSIQVWLLFSRIKIIITIKFKNLLEYAFEYLNNVFHMSEVTDITTISNVFL